MELFLIKLGCYLVRWQLSTPILAGVPILYKKFIGRKELTKKDIWNAIIIGNLIGGLIFFWIDKFIFLG